VNWWKTAVGLKDQRSTQQCHACRIKPDPVPRRFVPPAKGFAETIAVLKDPHNTDSIKLLRAASERFGVESRAITAKGVLEINPHQAQVDMSILAMLDASDRSYSYWLEKYEQHERDLQPESGLPKDKYGSHGCHLCREVDENSRMNWERMKIPPHDGANPSTDGSDSWVEEQKTQREEEPKLAESRRRRPDTWTYSYQILHSQKPEQEPEAEQTPSPGSGIFRTAFAEFDFGLEVDRPEQMSAELKRGQERWAAEVAKEKALVDEQGITLPRYSGEPLKSREIEPCPDDERQSDKTDSIYETLSSLAYERPPSPTLPSDVFADFDFDFEVDRLQIGSEDEEEDSHSEHASSEEDAVELANTVMSMSTRNISRIDLLSQDGEETRIERPYPPFRLRESSPLSIISERRTSSESQASPPRQDKMAGPPPSQTSSELPPPDVEQLRSLINSLEQIKEGPEVPPLDVVQLSLLINPYSTEGRRILEQIKEDLELPPWATQKDILETNTIPARLKNPEFQKLFSARVESIAFELKTEAKWIALAEQTLKESLQVSLPESPVDEVPQIRIVDEDKYYFSSDSSDDSDSEPDDVPNSPEQASAHNALDSFDFGLELTRAPSRPQFPSWDELFNCNNEKSSERSRFIDSELEPHPVHHQRRGAIAIPVEDFPDNNPYTGFNFGFEVNHSPDTRDSSESQSPGEEESIIDAYHANNADGISPSESPASEDASEN
jgi:hypothetical protein